MVGAHASSADYGWFERYGSLHRQNGYLSAPTHIYRGFLPLIRQSGRILDLGCGNGLLLRYLVEHAGHDLVPYGVDLDAAAVDVARTVVLLAYAANFQVEDVRRPRFGVSFDIVVTNPVFANPGFHEQADCIIQKLHPDGSIRKYIDHCLSLLSPNGDLILYAYEEEYRRVGNFHQVFNREVEGLDLQHSVAELGRAAYWMLRGPGPAAHQPNG